MKSMDSTELNELLRVYSGLEYTKPEIMNYFQSVSKFLSIPAEYNILDVIESLNDPKEEKDLENFRHKLNLLVLYFGGFTPERVEMISPAEKEFIEDAVAFVDRLPNKEAVMAEIENVTNLELAILTHIFEEYLFKILSMNGSAAKEDVISLYNFYLYGWGLYLYLRREFYNQIHHANKIDPNNSNTFFRSPVPYETFYLLSQDPSKTRKSQQILGRLQKQAERRTRGLYHPEDDSERTMYRKFYPERQTEAEGLYNRELTKTLDKKLAPLTLPGFIDKVFTWDKNLAEFPSYYRKDLINVMESYEAERRGIPIKKWRELRKEMEEERERVNRKEATPERLERLYKESDGLIKKQVGVVYTDQPDFDDIPDEPQLSEEDGSASPEAYVESAYEGEYADANKKVGTLICEYVDSLTPQAKSQRGVGEFLLGNDIAEYINEITGHFKISKIHEDSGIPLETVKSFVSDSLISSAPMKKSSLILSLLNFTLPIKYRTLFSNG